MKKCFLPLACLLLIACLADNQKKEQPVGLLSKEKMIRILIDIHIAESKVIQRTLPSDSARSTFQSYKMQILKKIGVDQEAFDKSYQYYLADSKEMDAIYAVIVDSLSLRESKGNLSY